VVTTYTSGSNPDTSIKMKGSNMFFILDLIISFISMILVGTIAIIATPLIILCGIGSGIFECMKMTR
jgi:hypothetical protein